MKEYILTVAGAAVMSAFAMAMTPEAWQKYIRVITGIVVLSCIVAPAAKIIKTDISFSVPETETQTRYDEDMNRDLIMAEFKRSIEADIEERMKTEYGLNIGAEVEIGVNDKGEVEGVRNIRVTGDGMSPASKARLCQVYGVDIIYEN